MSKRIHMERRFECPHCGCADILVNKKGERVRLKYTCPNCKKRFQTEPQSNAA